MKTTNLSVVAYQVSYSRGLNNANRDFECFSLENTSLYHSVIVDYHSKY